MKAKPDGEEKKYATATGLKYFQLYLKEEIQTKSGYDFALGEILRGM